MRRNHLRLSIVIATIYIVLIGTFWGLMALDNPQVLRLSRTSIVMLVTYVISAFAARYVFGGFDVGKRKVRDITNSLLLSQFMTDFITYMMLMFMNTNSLTNNVFRFSAKKLMLVCIAAHIIEILIGSTLANRLYFRLQTGKNCCVISSFDNVMSGLSSTTAAKNSTEKDVVKSLDRKISNIRSALKNKNLSISSVIDYRETDDWKKEIEKSDYVVIYDVPLDYRKQIMEYAYKYDRNIWFSPEICDIIEVSSEHHMFEDSLMLYSPGFELTYSQKAVKRVMDIIGALLMIIISSPVWLVCTILIKLDDHGKVFFKQDRATKGGRPFKIYKFRTMRDSDKTLPMSQDDDRVTKAGKLIRKTRMDELPQLLNVLKGDMSLVGPRPEQVKYIHGFDQNYEEYEYRLKVKAGLTGYAQIEGKYNTTNKDKLILDLMYIQNYSIWLDIKLLMQTILVFFKKESSEGF